MPSKTRKKPMRLDKFESIVDKQYKKTGLKPGTNFGNCPVAMFNQNYRTGKKDLSFIEFAAKKTGWSENQIWTIIQYYDKGTTCVADYTKNSLKKFARFGIKLCKKLMPIN